MIDYACPECGYDGPHIQVDDETLECGSCYVEFSTVAQDEDEEAT